MSRHDQFIFTDKAEYSAEIKARAARAVATLRDIMETAGVPPDCFAPDIVPQADNRFIVWATMADPSGKQRGVAFNLPLLDLAAE